MCAEEVTEEDGREEQLVRDDAGGEAEPGLDARLEGGEGGEPVAEGAEE